MELKSNRVASCLLQAHHSIAAILLLCTLVVVLSGCRSANVAGTSLNDTDGLAAAAMAQAGAVAENAVAQAPSQPPSYALNGEQIAGDQNAQVQLASVESQAVAANVVTLRTLGANDDFQQIVRDAPGPVLLDFYADWCGPCRKQGKVLHSLESFAAANQAQIIKVDVDQHKDIARRFDVASLPTLVVLKNGETVDRKVGLTDESRLRSMLR